MEGKRNRIVSGFIIGTFVSLYLIVSLISTIHVIDFFKLSNPDWLAISLAIAFEIGAAASLASIIALKKMKKGLVWSLFIVLTAMQAMGNTYYAFTHLKDFASWVELFDLVDEELIYQKRVLSLISGAILPLVALGFIKSLVDYIKPEGDDIDSVESLDDMLTDSNHRKDRYEGESVEENIKEVIEDNNDIIEVKEKEPLVKNSIVTDKNNDSVEVEDKRNTILSPEHYTVFPKENKEESFKRRYPENLE